MVDEQDHQLDKILQVVQRQKEMGRAIGDELDIQNSLLAEIDEKVDITDARMKGANKQIKKLR